MGAVRRRASLRNGHLWEGRRSGNFPFLLLSDGTLPICVKDSAGMDGTWWEICGLHFLLSTYGLDAGLDRVGSAPARVCTIARMAR